MRYGASPGIPLVEIEGALIGGSILERVQTAPIVVELDPDCIHGDGAVEDVFVSGVWIRALRSGREEALCAAIGVHEFAELGCEGERVLYVGFEVEVEAVDRSVAEGAVYLRLGFGGVA